MTKKLKAEISPAVMRWARESAGYSVEAAATKLDVDPEAVEAWERGDDQPSIPKLRKAAEVYKRPLAVLYLREPPLNFQPMHDFRRLPEAGGGRFSPELTYELRLAQQRRQIALDLLAERGESPPKVRFKATLKQDPEEVGAEIREQLGVDHALQSSWKDPRVAFHAWRSRLEDLGVLVFQASRVDSTEASGFAFFDEQLPFVVVNRKDSWGRRVFSLMHELAHVALHSSGVSELDDEAPRGASNDAVEVYCNRAAAAALIPKSIFLSDPVIAGGGDQPQNWSDEAIAGLARTFAVSREAIVRRLLTFGRTTDAFYAAKRGQYAREYQLARQRERDNRGDQGIPRNMPRETLGDVGKPLVRMLLAHYHSDRISLSELSGFLGVKTRHIEGIERTLVGGL